MVLGIGFAGVCVLARGRVTRICDAVSLAGWTLETPVPELGLLVALFLVGAFLDWRGPAFAMRLVPWSLGLGVIFFGLTEFLNGAFIIFVIYEAAAMAGALAIYSFLATSHRLKGAGVVAAAITLNLMAAGVQASSASFKICVPFDHNGVFHLIQMFGVATLGLGLRIGMKPDVRGAILVTGPRFATPH